MTAAYPMPVPSSAKPVGGLGRLVAVARAARRETATLLRRHGLDRTPARSADEYEARWNRQQQAARWLSVADISQAPGLSSYGQAQLRALMEFGVFDISAPAFFTWRGRKIAHVVSQHAEPSSPVVELGCGLGKNLIALAASGFTNLGGLDVTPSAVCAVRRQFAHFGIECDARLGDLLDLGPSRDFLHGKTLFTNYVLEQLPRDLTTALTEIARTGPRQVLHIEPCPDRLPGRRGWERWPSYWHSRVNDYQTQLLAVLRRMERAGILRTTEITPLGFSPYVFHSGVLIRWEPRDVT